MSQSQKESKVVGYVLVRPTGELAETTIVSDKPEYLQVVYAKSLKEFGYRIAKVCEVTE